MSGPIVTSAGSRSALTVSTAASSTGSYKLVLPRDVCVSPLVSAGVHGSIPHPISLDSKAVLSQVQQTRIAVGDFVTQVHQWLGIPVQCTKLYLGESLTGAVGDSVSLPVVGNGVFCMPIPPVVSSAGSVVQSPYSFSCSEPLFSSSSVVESEQMLRSSVPSDQADSCQSVILESFPSSSNVEEGSEVLSDKSESEESGFQGSLVSGVSCERIPVSPVVDTPKGDTTHTRVSTGVSGHSQSFSELEGLHALVLSDTEKIHSRIHQLSRALVENVSSLS